ncbi:PhnD/SsuA/transferrin family substrate-binding protein [Candidatus Oscillochloris fontis]|uniref:PhnD/SsuA/transferrin family substrate-binding protein n=1 Tax=Candidatus Oscillochloris fontis TaxID=2496868 RepID=UPI00101DA579|nr:PhnD/SsuA/transferrin family substrate-binding protein [Candidatus Oscillochloris fontis]
MANIKFMVCPHDTVRNPDGWYRLVQFLTSHYELSLHFEMSLDFSEFREAMMNADLVYANPTDAINLIDQHGMKPLMRPADTYDEALIVTGPDGDLPDVSAINGAMVASVENLLPTRIGLKCMEGKGIKPAGILHRDSWLSVVRSVWNGEAPFGIVYRDAYEELSQQGRDMVRILGETEERSAFHMFVARPVLHQDLATLLPSLTEMHNDPDGASILKEISIPAWAIVSDDALAKMRALVNG